MLFGGSSKSPVKNWGKETYSTSRLLRDFGFDRCTTWNIKWRVPAAFLPFLKLTHWKAERIKRPSFVSWFHVMISTVGLEGCGERLEGKCQGRRGKGAIYCISLKGKSEWSIDHAADWISQCLKAPFFIFCSCLVKCSVLELLNTQSFPICYFYSSTKYNFPSLPTVPDKVWKLIISVSLDYCWFWRTDCLLAIFSCA